MKSIILLIIVVLIILVSLYYLLFKSNKLRKQLSLKANEINDGQQIKTIYTELTKGINTLLMYIKDIEINSGGISGTINDLHLNNIVSGDGIQKVGGILDVSYHFKNLVLMNFTNDLKFTGTQIVIDDVNNNSQQIRLYLTARAQKLN